MEPARKQARSQLRKQEAEDLAAEDAARTSTGRDATKTVEEIDDLLDEIDAVLEEQEVLTTFRQRGGE